MYRQFIDAVVFRRSTTHGRPSQVYVALTDSEGNKEFLWMEDYDYIDWVEDPLVLNGRTFSIDTEQYTSFA